MKYMIVILSLFICKTSIAQLVISEVIFSTNEVELKNVGEEPLSVIGTNIQSTGNSMFITTATSLSCGDYNVPPGGKVVIPIPYPVVSTAGDFFVFQGGQIPTSYMQWGGVQGFATLAFAEGLWDDPMSFIPAAMTGEVIALVDEEERKSTSGWLIFDDASPCGDNDQCSISAVYITNLECYDSGTPSDPSDDVFSMLVEVEGQNLPATVDVSISNGSLTPSGLDPLCNNCVFTSAPGMADGEEYMLTVAAANGMCSFSQVFLAPFSCSADCEMQSSQFIIEGCVDNDTPADPSDDYIEFIVRPFGFNLSDQYFLEFSFGNVEGPFPNSVPFAVLSSEGFYVPGSGDFSVTIIDGDNPNCTETIDVIDQENCSPNCFLSIDSLAVRCDDGGSPFDDSDDFYVVDIQMSTTASASTMYQASIDPFTAGPQMLAYGELYTFSSAPGSTNMINAYAMTFIDPAYPSCIGVTLNGMLTEGCLSECEIFTADIALDADPLICLEPQDESIFTFEIINGIVLDTFLLIALDEADDIVFITEKLSFDAREFDAGVYQFVVVSFLELAGVEIGADIGRLEGCFALSPRKSVEIVFAEECSTATNNIDADFRMYPNPVSNTVCIESSWLVGRVTVLDITGQIVLIETNKTCIDTDGLSRGMYWLQVEGRSSQRQAVRKLVKL